MACPVSEALLLHLSALEAEVHHPGAPCTPARLQQLLHADFHEVGRSGAHYGRAQVMTYLLGRTDIAPVRAFDHRLSVIDDTTALLLFDTEEPGPAGTTQRAARRASLWRCVGGDWQLRYHHATPL